MVYPQGMSKECLMTVEMEHEFGYRSWSAPMPESEVDAYIERYLSYGDYYLSDIDHSTRSECDCECMRS